MNWPYPGSTTVVRAKFRASRDARLQAILQFVVRFHYRRRPFVVTSKRRAATRLEAARDRGAGVRDLKIQQCQRIVRRREVSDYGIA